MEEGFCKFCLYDANEREEKCRKRKQLDETESIAKKPKFTFKFKKLK